MGVVRFLIIGLMTREQQEQKAEAHVRRDHRAGSDRTAEDVLDGVVDGIAKSVAGMRAPGQVSIAAVRSHPQTIAFLRGADAHLRAMGYTEHGERHAALVAKIASNVLDHLGHDARNVELAAIAGLLHDIGNVVNREMHGQTGAILAKDILTDLGMDLTEVVRVMGAIGNHETTWGHATDTVAAALILADKADVHRSRVHGEADLSDIHDRVNQAATRSFLRVDGESQRITLEIDIDTEIASVMNYFEIFTGRMVFCRSASEYLGCRFALEVNGQRLS